MDLKKHIAIPLICLILLLTAGQMIVYAGGQAHGFSFTMVMQAGDRDPVEFEGCTLGDSLCLSAATGGIATVTLLLGSDLYILTPSVKTARKVDNPPPPDLDEGGWIDWLVEPGRINPMNFAGIIGLDDDFSGQITAGAGGGVKFTFDDGELRTVEFPMGRLGGSVVYRYSEIESDNSVSASDVSIPSDFLVID